MVVFNFLMGLFFDGLTDVYNKIHMGNCGENTAKKMNISRAEQDEYGINSYKKSAKSVSEGIFKSQIVPVSIPQKKRKTGYCHIRR